MDTRAFRFRHTDLHINLRLLAGPSSDMIALPLTFKRIVYKA